MDNEVYFTQGLFRATYPRNKHQEPILVYGPKIEDEWIKYLEKGVFAKAYGQALRDSAQIMQDHYPRLTTVDWLDIS